MKNSSEHYLILSFSFFLTVGASNLNAHEFWLEPQSFHVRPDASVSIDLKSGEGFTGITYPWIPKRVLNTGPITDATLIPANTGREPALRAIANTSGLTALYYQSNPSKLSHESFEDFENFLKEESLLWVRDRHKQRGLPETGFTEYYSRYTKTLLQAGHISGRDKFSGNMPYEWVALTNPYSTDFDIKSGYSLQLFENKEPVTNTHVTYFIKNKNSSAEAELRTARTDDSGVVKIPYQKDSNYLVSAVLMTENYNKAIPWHSHWVSITYGSLNESEL